MADFFSGLFGGLGQAAQYRYAGAAAQAKGLAQKNALYSKAGALEQDARVNQAIASYNMAQVREVQRRAEASVFNASVNSGFMTDSGTAGAGVAAVRNEYNDRVANMGMASAMETRNAMNQAENLRLEGNNALRAGEAENAMYRSLAKSTRQVAFLNAYAGYLKAVGGAMGGYTAAEEYNDMVSEWNEKNPGAKLKEKSVTRSTLAGGFAGLNGQTNLFSF